MVCVTHLTRSGETAEMNAYEAIAPFDTGLPGEPRRSARPASWESEDYNHPRHSEYDRLRYGKEDALLYRSLCAATVVAYGVGLEVVTSKEG